MFEYSMRAAKRDPVYCLWSAFALYYLLRDTKHTDKKLSYAIRIQKYCEECLEINYKDINALFILLHLTLDMDEYDHLSYFEAKYKSEEIAIWIKEIDEYKGYLAWVEIYLRRDDIDFANEVLDELIEFYPDNPEAYFKLWRLKDKDSDECLDIAEKMFL